MVCLLGSSVDTNKDRNKDTKTDTIQSDCNSPTYGLVRRMLLEDGVFDGNIWSVLHFLVLVHLLCRQVLFYNRMNRIREIF